MLHEVSENLLVPHQGLNVKGEGRDEAVGGGWGKFSSEAYVKKSIKCLLVTDFDVKVLLIKS